MFQMQSTGQRSSNYPLRRVVHLAERDDENEVFCELDGYGEEKEDYEEDDKGQNYMVRKLILTPKQEKNT